MARKQGKPPTKFGSPGDVFSAYVGVLQRHGAESRQERHFWSNPALARHMSAKLVAQMLGMHYTFIVCRTNPTLLAKRR